VIIYRKEEVLMLEKEKIEEIEEIISKSSAGKNLESKVSEFLEKLVEKIQSKKEKKDESQAKN